MVTAFNVWGKSFLVLQVSWKQNGQRLCFDIIMRIAVIYKEQMWS